MKPVLRERTRRLGRVLLASCAVFFLVGAGASGLHFTGSAMDLVLIQLVFYGAWAALLGGWAGGLLGAAVEEDTCGELDMGVSSSMGAFLGAAALSLIAGAATGLALYGHWIAVWVGAVLLTLLTAAADLAGVRVRRRPGFDLRGQRIDPDGRPLPDAWQPQRMRDRFTILVTLAVLLMVALTAFMAVVMGSDLGNPVMLAPMCYAMGGGMLGGILGGWVAGVRDEHLGNPQHDNAVMVASMALMSGMMGAMPAAMVAGMMAVMGKLCIEVTVASGLLLALFSLALLVHGRYRLHLGPASVAPAWAAPGDEDLARVLTLHVEGMSCAECGHRVHAALVALPGVQAVQVDVPGGRVALTCGPGFGGVDGVARALDEAGHPVVRS